MTMVIGKYLLGRAVKTQELTNILGVINHSTGNITIEKKDGEKIHLSKEDYDFLFFYDI